ncbi:capsule assembly Wzi family protein [Hymenobacter sp. RP-2-7]|uniref:Capsule assembly Wzi family protein n=1 Tax=Hymenobacter polaris TaxID=2682546 RepID=A0A7Y0AB34_9BACT|nr:capsule assembly Wzi family protein [Hymenobacter polaris]NML64106.1 capsule assembly Wzi family protein [Hymenobacter polaris]
MRILLLVVVGCLLVAHSAAAQFADSLQLAAGVVGTAATKGYQPLWIIANRYGTISDQQVDAAVYLRVSNQHVFAKKQPAETPGQVRKPGFYVGYGAALYNNNHLGSTFLNQGYVQAGYRTWQLRAGRQREYTGEIDQSLSSGSFGISGNALPIPKITLAVTDYTPIPFTHGWVQFKGQFAHGWLGDAEGITNVFLHQKSLYLRVGKERWSFYGGLTHFAQWGGTFPSGRAPSRFSDYLRIVAGASGNDADPVYHQGPIDIDNAVGNHLLIPDFGVTFRKNNSTFRLYTQTIFDKGVGDSANASQRDRLAGLKILWRDRLVGFSWETSRRSLLQKVLVEGIYTKYQGGPVIYQGRDNYYNNGTYIMGWQYQGRIIGTPLFINRAAAENYGFDLNANAISGWNIISNRLIGVHLGAKGNLSERLTYRLLATHVLHYGNYYNTAYFTPAKNQTHLLLELPYRFPHFALAVAAASDFGDLSNNAAGMLRCEWFLR